MLRQSVDWNEGPISCDGEGGVEAATWKIGAVWVFVEAGG